MQVFDNNPEIFKMQLVEAMVKLNDDQLICVPNNFLIRVPKHLDWFKKDLFGVDD